MPRSWNSKIPGNKKSSNNEGSSSEDIERIVSQYDEKSKNFIRIFALLLGLSILFLFMIFLPYIFTLRNSNETFQTLNEVQELSSNLTAVRNDTIELQSNLGDNPILIKTYFERLIGNSINYYDNCLKGNYDSNSRLIQTTDSEVREVMQNIRTNSLWPLDVCNRLNMTKPLFLAQFYTFIEVIYLTLQKHMQRWARTEIKNISLVP